MNTIPPNPPETPASGAPDRDLLISRVVDGVSARADWATLEEMARADAGLWRDLAYAQHDHAALCRAAAPDIQTAEHVRAPVDDPMVLRLTHRSRQASAWAGWAAAAAIGLAWLGVAGPQHAGLDASGPEPIVAGGPGGWATAADALQSYLEKGKESGQVIGQVPGKLLIDARPSPDGAGYEVVYLRQVLERATVPDLYRATRTEEGDVVPVPVPMRPAGSRPM